MHDKHLKKNNHNIYTIILVTLTLFICLIMMYFLHDNDQVKLQEIRHSFGIAHQWTTLTHTFKITNNFNKNLELSDIKPSCKCTTILIGKTVLHPNEETTLVMKFETRDYMGHREVNTLIKGFVEGKQIAICNLILDAVIEPVVTFSNKTRYWNVGQYELGGCAEATNIHILRGNNPLAWDTIKCQSLMSKVQVHLMSVGQNEWDLKIIPIVNEGETGVIFDDLELTFWDKGRCVYSFKKNVSAIIRGPIVPVPQSLLLGVIEAGDSQTKIITFDFPNKQIEDKFQIISLKSSDPNMVFVESCLKTQSEYVCTENTANNNLKSNPNMNMKLGKPAIKAMFSPRLNHCGARSGEIVVEYSIDKTYTIHIDYLLRVVNKSGKNTSYSLSNNREKLGTLELSVNLWNNGEKEKAVDELLKISATKIEPWSKSCILSMTQEKLKRLPLSKLPKKQDEIIQYSRTIKIICHHAARKGESYLEKGDFSSAEHLFKAILNCGNFLAKPEKLTNLDGLAIQKLALKNLKQLYERTGDQEKKKEIINYAESIR